ncbi:rho GTPase-activating protein 31 [Rhinophrynus dorsalis]
MKNKGAKAKLKRKGSAFGCDLTEYLENSGQDVPNVLKSCAEFIETHGVVDGIYRLSGVTSNIQKLRQEFGSDQCPDLTRDVYLQDIHCVGSLCKLYFRELPNPLLTYQLYKKFTDAVSCPAEGEQLSQIQNVIQELPPSHYRTLEYLSKHLTHIASHSSTTNMHIRNLALVWAPNLLRSKDIEDVGCNGDAAFLEVRVQQVVIEFILNHVEQIFNKNSTSPTKQRDECRVVMMKSMTLPSGSLPMKLVSLEEAQAMSLSATHPARKERRENSLPEITPVTGTLFHTVIDLPENKRKLSTKSKKWKSIFNLGRSGSESKSKLSRNGSVFVRGQKEMNEKATIRPAKSMDSLCSLPAEGEDEKMSRFKRSVATGGFFIPVLKSRATGTGSTYDVRKPASEWETDDVTGASGGLGSNQDKTNSKTSQPKPPPEQMKVFRVGEDFENEQTSPKIRKMFYTSSDGPTKSSFPGSLFPLEASPRHQRKAVNISEPFAVSVPLRVSAVISANSTPCRVSSKDRPPLSSLEELPLLEPIKGAKSTSSGSRNNTGLKERPHSPATSEMDKFEQPKRPCLKDLERDSLDDDTPLTIKEVLLEMLQLSEGNLPRFEPTAQKKQPTEQALTPIDNVQVDGDLKPYGPDLDPGRTQEVETQNNDPEDPFHNDQEDDASINLLDPLWSDIQQELKIVESEEELPVSEVNHIPSSPVLQKALSDSVMSNCSSDDFKHGPILSELNNVDDSSASVVLRNGGNEEGNKDQNHDPKCPPQTSQEIVTAGSSFQVLQAEASENLPPQENLFSTDQEGMSLSVKEMGSNSETSKEENKPNFLQTLPLEREQADSGFTQAESQVDGNVQVITDFEPPRREEDQELRRLERKSSGSVENDDDSVQTFELEEFLEDHQWVTSPLHSPKLKCFPEKEMQMVPSQRRGTTGEIYKRPEFTRSLSLDSKDSRKSQWTCRLAGMNKVEGVLYLRSENDQLFRQNLQKDFEQSRQVRKMFNLPELPAVGKNNDSLCGKDNNDKQHKNDPMLELSTLENSGPLNSNLKFPSLPSNSVDGLCKVQDRNHSPTLDVQQKSTQSNIKTEDAAETPQSQPSSLILVSAVPLDESLTYERASTPSSADMQNEQIQQTHITTNISPSDGPKPINQWKNDLGKSQSHLNSKETGLNNVSVTHIPTGRRNSAPVSVSAVRASFMIKMCQAKAVPVIPPQVQYTQIPQPLQTVNADSEVPPVEKKEVVGQSECNSNTNPPLTTSKGHTDIPKSPKPEKKALEEKENNDPITLDSSHLSNLNSSADSNHVVVQDAPVLRRKRTSDGEAAVDTPLSSKIERPSVFSKPSFRSRPGRPQSLILFSPPFPIMDHTSPADSRILLTPIKSPTTSQESANDSQRTPDGVILRNKLTIPKNGQRLETSTSCFYQPQRRSVILDSRSGRQIE